MTVAAEVEVAVRTEGIEQVMATFVCHLHIPSINSLLILFFFPTFNLKKFFNLFFISSSLSHNIFKFD